MKKVIQVSREKMSSILNKYIESQESKYTEEELGNFWCITASGQYVVCYNETGHCINDSTYVFENIENILEEMEYIDKKCNK